MKIQSIGAVISYLTVEGAEEAVKDIQGVAKNMIKQHEDFALFALVALIAGGVVSILGWDNQAYMNQIGLGK